MEYNTKRKKLILPEYGRNIQKMVNYAKNIEDKDERNKVANAIIDVMGNMNPHLRDINEFKHKLWEHLALMSEFDLDIDFQYVATEAEMQSTKPNQVPYNTNNIKYRYFGKTIVLLINKAIEIEDLNKKDALVETICNHLKKNYIMWNKDVVNDFVIFEALKDLSNGQLVPKEGLRLTESKEISLKTKRKRVKKN